MNIAKISKSVVVSCRSKMYNVGASVVQCETR